MITKADLNKLEDTVRRDMHELENRIVLKLIAMMAASIVVVAMLVKLF